MEKSDQVKKKNNNNFKMKIQHKGLVLYNKIEIEFET